MTLPLWKSTGSAQWDTLVIGGYPFPGVATLKITPKRKVQIKTSKDTNGTSLEDTGYEGAKIDGKLRVWTDEQVDEIFRLLSFLHPRSQSGVSTPLTIVHPIATMFGIQAIYFPEFSIATPTATFFELSFKALEWFPGLKKKPPSPGGTGGSSGTSGGKVDASDFTPPQPNPKFAGGNVP